MYTKHNGDNAKLRMFSFIPRRQRIQPNFINHTYQTTKHTNATRTTKTTTSTWVLPLIQSLCSYNWDNANSEVFIFKLCKYWPISYISFIANFMHLFHHPNICTGLLNNFVHFIQHQFYALISSIPKYLYLACSRILYISSIPTWVRYLWC